MADHDGNHKCLAEKNVPVVLILPSKLQDGVESLGMETTSCLGQDCVVVLLAFPNDLVQKHLST